MVIKMALLRKTSSEFLFGTGSPSKSMKLLREHLTILENKTDIEKSEKVQKEVTNQLSNISKLLFGGDKPQHLVLDQLIQEMCKHAECSNVINKPNQRKSSASSSCLLLLLLRNLHKLDFDGRKHTDQIVITMLQHKTDAGHPTVDHIATNPEVVFTLLRGYDNQEITLNCGNMLRQCLVFQPLASLMMHLDHFLTLFHLIKNDNSAINMDAFASFKSLLTTHKAMAAQFLEANYDDFFESYKTLLNSGDYVTRRQSLRLLSGLLMEAQNYIWMKRFISSSDNLKLIMILLNEESQNIKNEAFHVFKIFVVNQVKTKPIQNTLVRNQDKLVVFLTRFVTEDEQIMEEKVFVVKLIRDLTIDQPEK